MSDDRVYKDGDIVWAKLGNNWWPGEVTDVHRQPEGLLKHLKKKPYCVVKFFQEDAYEYIKSAKQIFPFQCSKKDEFIKKGTALYNAKNKFMEKFPSDVEIAERLTRKAVASDLLIINDRPDSIVKAILGPTYIRRSNDYYDNEYNNSSCNTDYNNKRRSGDSVTKILNITPQRTTTTTSTTTHSPETGTPLASPLIRSNYNTNSVAASSADTNFYRCNLCNFSSQRQNVMIMHRRTHSAGGIPTAGSTPARKTPSATITSAAKASANAISGTTPSPSPAASTKGTSSSLLNENVERKNPATLGTSAAYIPKSENNATTLNMRNANGNRNRQQPPLVEAESAARSAAGSSRQKLRPPLRIDADVTEITLPDGMPIGAQEGELKLSDDDTTDNSSSPATEELLRTCSPRKHNLEAGESGSTSVMLKSTAEEIQQRLLADWSDEEKDDETVDYFKVHAKRSDVPVAEGDASKISELTIQARVIKKDEPVYGIAMPITEVVSNVSPQTSNQNQNRIRNIPKKDRRDAVLKEFTSDYTVKSPEAVVNLESINCSSSNSSDSVVVVAVVPPNGGETIIVDDNTGTDGETEVSVGEAGINGTEMAAHSLLVNDVREGRADTLNEVNDKTAVQGEIPTKVEEDAVEYPKKMETYERVEQSEDNPAMRLKNGDEFVLVATEVAKNEVVETEEIKQMVSDEEIYEIDLKSENEEGKLKAHKQSAKQRGREKRNKPKRRQETATEALETPTKSEHVPMETAEALMPMSPQRLKQEEPPLTSTAAAQRQQQRTDCFEFQEEEDDSCSEALKSIADFKKKYLSPEKAQEKALADNGLPPDSEKRRSTEQKDQQLAHDIEKLLEQTTAPSIVDTAIPAVVSRTHSYGSSKEELPVKGLPIKERGKRIFKSRNRSRIDEVAPLANVGMEGAAPIQIVEPIEPKVEEPAAVAKTEERQEDEKQQNIEEAANEARVEQHKVLADVEGAGMYENAPPPATTPPIAVPIDNEKSEEVGKVEADEEIGVKEEIIRIESAEESTILRLKTVNGSVVTATAMEVVSYSSVEEKKCEAEEVNGENIGPMAKSQINDEWEGFGKIIEADKASKGNDDASTQPDNERKAKENAEPYENDSKLQDLGDQTDNTTQRVDAEENSGEHTNLSAHEVDNAGNEQQILMEVKGNAAGEEGILREDLNVVPDTPEDKETITEPNSLLAQVAVVTEASEVPLTEPQASLDDKEPLDEADDSLAAALKNDVAEDHQNDAALIGEELPQSRITSPTDDNSSVCISEAGAEFGSPTSMLDDERLPTITGRLMTPTDALMEVMPTGSEGAKVLEGEKEIEGVGDVDRDREVQNTVETALFVAGGEGGEMELIEEVPANENIGERTIVDGSQSECIEERNEAVEGKSKELMSTIGPDGHNEVEDVVKEPSVEQANLVEQMTAAIEQAACVNMNSPAPQSVSDESGKNNLQDCVANVEKLDDEKRAENDNLVIAESGETLAKVQPDNPSESQAGATFDEKVEVIGESGNSEGLVDNSIKEQEEARNAQSDLPQDVLLDAADEEHPQAEQQEKDVNAAELLDNDKKVVPAEVAATKAAEHIHDEDSDIDDDFIESPPHEPLSGHEGDTEALSLRAKVLTKTQKRRLINKNENANAPPETEEEKEQLETRVERLKRRSAKSASVSPQRIDEFTKEVTSGKRLTRATRQQQAKSNDYMKELDLSDLHEAATKDENDEKKLKQITTSARQKQRKSTKVSKLTVNVNETNEKCEAAFAEVVNATHEANAPAPTTPDVAPAEPMASPPCSEAASEVIVEETAAISIPPVKSVGSSRKRRSATRATPDRNSSGATQNDTIKESELIEQEELIERAKSRRVESSNDGSDTLIEIIQTQEEQTPVDDEANSESAIDSYIEVDPAEMQVEDNADANAQDNEANTSLVVEGDEQCIIEEEVYLNDTTAPIEEAVDAAVSEINSLRTQDVPNAIEYVDYVSIEHQQPIEEVIVGAVDTVEATADIDTPNNLNSSPNDASAPMNQQKAAAVHDAQPKSDNVGINTSPMEKVRINVDVANPLSTQIANILATKSAGGTGSKKSNLEESIPSFIIERPGQIVSSQSQHTPSSNLDFTIGEQDAVAHVQQMCPQVKITRKEKFIDETPTSDVVQQETAGAMFDISNMPIVLGNEHFMSAQGDMQIVLTSSPEAETHLRTDGPQILQQQILQTAYRTSTQTGQQRQRKRSTNQQQQQQQPLQQASKPNSQVGNNKPGIIIIKAAPSDLIIQQSQSAVMQGSQQQSQAIAGGAAQHLVKSPTEKTTTTYNLGSGVTLRPIAEPKQKQQQRQQKQQQQQNQQTSANKPKSPAAAATGGRKQAGNTITLPSSITVKQRQQKVTDGLKSAASTAKLAPSQQQQQQLSQSASVSGTKTAQKRNNPTNWRRSQSQVVQQRRLTVTASSLAELEQQQKELQRGAIHEDVPLLNRRLSYTEVHAPPPAKIPRSADYLRESTFAATAEQQLLQLQQQQLQQQRQKIQCASATEPPPLLPLQNRKQRHSVSQQHRRMSTKAESTASQEQQQQQQQQQRLQSTQIVLLDQQQSQCLEEQQQQQQQLQQHEQHVTAVHIAELESSSSTEEIVPAAFEAVELQAPEVYTEEILAEEFEANEHTPSVIAVPSQPVPGYPDTLLLCRRVGDEWVPVVAQPFFYTGSDQQLRPIPKEVLIGRPILTPSTDKATEFPIETDELQMVAAGETYKEETGVTILIGNNYVHMEWDQFLEVMRSNDDVYNLRDENGHVFQLTRDALVALQQDANMQDKYRQLQQLLEEQQLEEQQQLEQQELLQQQFIQQLQTVTVTGEEGLEADIIPLLHIDTTQTLQLIGTDDGNLILQPTLVQPPLSPPCSRPALTNATNALLNQTPIMSPLEKPSTAAAAAASTLIADGTGQHIDLGSSTTSDHLVAAGFIAADADGANPACRPTLGDSLAVIGVVPTQPTLLPTTVTNPAIAPPKSDLIPNMTTAAQMHAQYRQAQRAIYNDPGS